MLSLAASNIARSYARLLAPENFPHSCLANDCNSNAKENDDRKKVVYKTIASLALVLRFLVKDTSNVNAESAKNGRKVVDEASLLYPLGNEE